MFNELRQTGIPELGDQPWGTHFCVFYESKADLIDLLVAYFTAGLDAHEYCLYVASEPASAEDVEQAFRAAIPNFDQRLADGQFELIPHQSWYLAGGRFDGPRARQRLTDKRDQALAQGYAGLRFAANTFWLPRQTWQSFSKYEAQIDGTFSEGRLVALCAYALEQCSASDMLDVVHHHQYTVARRQGAWEPLEGSALKHAHAEIRRLNADLEHQVEERTRQLAAANEQLQTDVAELKRSEEARLESEARLQASIEAAEIGLWDWDLVSDQVTWLGQHERLFGLSPGEFDGTSAGFSKYVHPEDLDALNQTVQRAREAGSVHAYDYRVVWKDGSVHWLAAWGRFVCDPTGQPIRMYGALRDITDRREREAALRQSEADLAEAQRVAHLGNWSLDIATDALRWSDELYRIFDVDAADFGGKYDTFVSRVHPDDRARVLELNAAARTSGQAFEVEYRITTRSGQLRYIREVGYARLDAAGVVSGLFGTAQDITARAQAEAALRRSEADYRALADNSLQGITIFQNGAIVYTNPAVSKTLGYSAKEFEAMSTEQIIALTHPDDRALAVERVQKRLAGEALSPSIEVRAVHKDGAPIWLQAFNSPIVYRGQPALISTTINITERKLAEAESRRRAAQMEALAGISQALAEVGLEVQAVFETLVRYTAEVIGDAAVIRLLSADEQWFQVAAFHHTQPATKALLAAVLSGTPISASQEMFAHLLLTGQGLLIPEVDQAELKRIIGPDYGRYIEQVGSHSILIVPLRSEGRVIGSLSLTREQPGRPYLPEDQVLLQNLADRAALTIQNARLFQSISEQREQLSRLSAQLTNAQEAERRAIARELHDEIGQQLYAVSANLEAIRISPDAPTLTGRLADSASLVDEAIQRVRDLALELRPSMLDDFGLLPALTWLVERQAQRSGYEAKFAAEPPDLRLPAWLDTTVFRIVQNALTNVARHAQAQHVSVTVLSQDGALVLQVDDDGVGFDVAAALERANQGNTLGLLSMQERVRLAGGTLDIDSGSGRGTHIRAQFPLDQAPSP